MAQPQLIMSAAIDNDGKLLWSTGWGHGDALHVSDFDNDGKQEVFKVNEDKPNYGRGFVQGDGTISWLDKTTSDDDRGVMGNFSPKYGVLAWDSGLNTRTLDGTVVNYGSINARGEQVSVQDGSSPNFTIFWDGDFYEEHFDGDRISKWYDYDTPDDLGSIGGFGRLWTLYSNNPIASNNSTKKNACLQADLFGDWREEIIVRHSDDTALRVFTSLIPTEHKLTTFMHDSQYRCAVAWQNTGYNQPPHQSYYIGEEKTEYVQPNIETRALDPEIKIVIKNTDNTPLAGVNVTLNGIEKPTNSEGIVSYRVAAGKEYSYTINQYGYKSISGTVNFASGAEYLEQPIALEPLPESTISVKSGDLLISGAAVTIDGQTISTDENGTAIFKLNAGQYDCTVSCHKYITKTEKIDISENGGAVSIDVEPIQYVYDSAKDAEGSKFTYSGGDGAELSFSGGRWTFNQNSTDGGRSFGAVFDTSTNGNMEFEMTYATGGQKDSSDKWNWSGRNYTHEINLLDVNGNTLIGLSQSYTDSGAQEVKYYTGSKSKTNVSSGTMIGAPNITARSASTWKIKFAIDLKAKTVDLTLTDENGENGYSVKDIPINVTNFSRVSIGSTASGNVTWIPTVKDVLYYSDCLGEVTPDPTEKPIDYETWDFNDLSAGSAYGSENKTISNNNGNEITINYGTSAADGAVPPAITERTSGDNYLKLDDKGSGTDGWSYEPKTALDSEKVVFETDFLMGDTAKDTILLRVCDKANANSDNTYTDKTDGRVLEIKTGSTVLKLTDYFSKGASDTKGLDTDIPNFVFEANKWYGLKLEYTKDDNLVKVYTKSGSGNYALNLTYTLGSGTTKAANIPALAPSKLECATRGSAANVLGVDNIKIGVLSTGPSARTETVLSSDDTGIVLTTNVIDLEPSGQQVYVAAYAANDTLIEVKTAEYTTTDPITTNFDSNPDISYFKIFVWSSPVELSPQTKGEKIINK